jgi:epoxyqueuosine reductase QueG
LGATDEKLVVNDKKTQSVLTFFKIYLSVYALRWKGEDNMLDEIRIESSVKQVALKVSDTMDASELHRLCLDCGADDVGFVALERPELDPDRQDIKLAFSETRTLIGIVSRMLPDNIRTPLRSIANIEFHHTGDRIEQIAREILKRLAKKGVRGVYPSVGFPMEMDRYPGKIWSVSHKLVAEAAGLGKMGVHRNIIHPQFGNFILLGTIFIDAKVTQQSQPLDYNPCLKCKLCVAACPVGAIGMDGNFDFGACMNHNYKEFMGGFQSYVETIANAKNGFALRHNINDAEHGSWWQSLSFGANYKAAYCLSVCPAGEEVIRPYQENKAAFKQKVLKPLVDKVENIYVIKNSDAEAHVEKRFPNKSVRHVANAIRPRSIEQFLTGMPLIFNRHQAGRINAVFHFRFSGAVEREATVVIRDKKIIIKSGRVGEADLTVSADAETWIKFLRKENNLFWILLTRKLRLRGDPRLLIKFGKCFPT